MLDKHSEVLLYISIALIIALSVKSVYKTVLKKLTGFNKKLGKINSFFSKLFSHGDISNIYLDFYGSLPFSLRLRSLFLKRYIHIDNSMDTGNEFGIKLTLNKAGFICIINAVTFKNSEAQENDFQTFLEKFLKGKLDLVIINQALNFHSKDEIETGALAISNSLEHIASYLAIKVKYIINIDNIHNCTGHEQWDILRKHFATTNYWPNQKPTPEWADSIVTDNLHHQLFFNAQAPNIDTNNIRDLFFFLNNCTKIETFISAIAEHTPEKISIYQGFGVNLTQEKQLPTTLSTNHCYKFTTKLKACISGVLISSAAVSLVAGASHISHIIPHTIRSIDSGHIAITPSEINLVNYKTSQALVKQNDLNFISSFLYSNNFIHNREDRVWLNIIKKEVLTPALLKSTNPVQKYALTIMLQNGSNNLLNRQIKHNLWLWSKVTGIPIEVIKVWLNTDHMNHGYQHPLESKKTTYSYIAPGNKEKIINDIDYILNDIYLQYFSSKLLVSNDLKHESIQLDFINQMTKLKSSAISSQVSDIATRYHYKLLPEQEKNMDNFIEYLQVREELSQIKNDKDMYSIVRDLDGIYQKIKNQENNEWNKALTARFLSRISSNLIYNHITRLYSQIKNLSYYSKLFYENRVSPLYHHLIRTISQYSKIGLNSKQVQAKLYQQFINYGFQYQKYYQNSILNSVSLDTSNNAVFISELSEISLSPALQNTLKSIQKNVLSLNASDPYMNNIVTSFKGINHFIKSQDKYDSLLELYANELKNSISNPQKLAEYYINKEDNFNISMATLLDSFKLSKDITKILLKPALDAESIGAESVKSYSENYWHNNLTPDYKKLFSYFPFNKKSSKDISVNKLNSLINKGGDFWKKYSPVIGKLANNYPNYSWLSAKQLQMYNEINYLRNYLWDSNGKNKDIILTITTTNKLPTYNHIHHGWFGIRRKESEAYSGILSSGQSYISDIGIANVSKKFDIKWWQPQASSIKLTDINGNTVQQQSRNGLWSFWHLINIAKQENNKLTWKFNHNKTNVEFKVNPSDFNRYAHV